jgi:hypothetical protein
MPDTFAQELEVPDNVVVASGPVIPKYNVSNGLGKN